MATKQDRVHTAARQGAASARDLAVQTNLTEKQVRNAIDALRRRHGRDYVINLDGQFAIPRPGDTSGAC
jgi:hypothetical protein